jgi:endoglycosylceramidase
LQTPFAEWNLAAELQSSWYPLYHNSTLQAHFAGFWGAVARQLNTSEHILGYELINEPLPCDGYHDLDVLCYLDPAKTDLLNLMPLYQQAWERIRESDQEHIVMYEPSVIEGDIHQATGFQVGPGGAGANATQALAYHVYCFNQDAAGDITNTSVCDKQMQGTFDMARQDIQRVGGGHFVTEFGALGDGNTSVQAIHHQTAAADALLESWAYWTYKGFHDITTQNPATESFFNEDGSTQVPKVSALSRTYAQRVAGLPSSIAMKFAGEAPSKDFLLTYTTNGAAHNTSTVVYLNEDWHYPAGYTLAVVPQGVLQATSPGKNYLHLTHQAGVQVPVSVSIVAM